MEICTPHACLSTRASQSIANTASTVSGFHLESAVSIRRSDNMLHMDHTSTAPDCPHVAYLVAIYG